MSNAGEFTVHSFRELLQRRVQFFYYINRDVLPFKVIRYLATDFVNELKRNI